MKKLEIYGPGCPRCEQLAKLIGQAAPELGIPYQLEKVTDIKRITDAGVMMTPALALLLAGPALSLPSMIVLIKVMGARKALTYIVLVILMATITGMLFGVIAG